MEKCFMGRPRKNPLPVNAVAENDAAAVETKAAAQETAAPEVTTADKEEAKPARKRAGRPPKNAKTQTEKKEEKKPERKRAGRKPAEKTVEKVEEKTEEKTEKKAVEGKKAGRPAKNPEVAVTIQFEGKNIETKNVAEIAKENWVASGKKESSIKTLEIYINVTEGMAYPVINGEAQSGFSCS